MNTRSVRHDSRLAAVISLLRPGVPVADIGTDHAYLPIALIRDGRWNSVLASDVSEGPVAKAVRNIAAAGLSDRITVRQADGLDGIESYAPKDIVLCGMGGDLIARLLSRSAYILDPSVHLVLQPMTGADELRVWLCRNGFAIPDERLAKEDRRIYEVMLASYCGFPEELSPVDALLGKTNIERGGELFQLRLKKAERYLSEKISGRKASGADTSKEEELLCAVKSYMKN